MVKLVSRASGQGDQNFQLCSVILLGRKASTRQAVRERNKLELIPSSTMKKPRKWYVCNFAGEICFLSRYLVVSPRSQPIKVCNVYLLRFSWQGSFTACTM